MYELVCCRTQFLDNKLDDYMYIMYDMDNGLFRVFVSPVYEHVEISDEDTAFLAKLAVISMAIPDSETYWNLSGVAIHSCSGIVVYIGIYSDTPCIIIEANAELYQPKPVQPYYFTADKVLVNVNKNKTFILVGCDARVLRYMTFRCDFKMNILNCLVFNCSCCINDDMFKYRLDVVKGLLSCSDEVCDV